MTEIRVPTLGESVTEATVATWFKEPGDIVNIDEMLCELETDKVTVEVPSTVSGTLSEIVAKEGETVGLDAILGIITEGSVQKVAKQSSQEKTPSVPNQKIDENQNFKDLGNAPSAKKLMQDPDVSWALLFNVFL